MDHSATHLRMLLESAERQLASSHAAIIEDALWTGIIRANGSMPSLDQIRKHTHLFSNAVAGDRWDEYRWKNELMFETRIVTTKEKGRTFIGTEIRWPK